MRRTSRTPQASPPATARRAPADAARPPLPVKRPARPAPPRDLHRPLFALTTDFGLSDSYVAEVKAVLLAACPGAAVVDVTHLVPPQDILAGSFVLERALRAFPAVTIHVAVVDPGVGTSRRIICARVNGQSVICPDNGLITWAWRRLPHEPTVRQIWPDGSAGAVPGAAAGRRAPSSTFHARDVMAPAAARLAMDGSSRKGADVTPELLDVAPLTQRGRAVVIHLDHYGNASTNCPAELLASDPPASVRVGRRRLPLARTYSDVPAGKPLALIGSSGLLEIAVRDGSAARGLGIRVGHPVIIT